MRKVLVAKDLLPLPQQEDELFRFGLGLAINYSNKLDTRWKHYCEDCVFTGIWKEYDLYTCDEGNRITVLARYGDEDCQFKSGIHAIHGEKALEMSLVAAMSLGLLSFNDIEDGHRWMIMNFIIRNVRPYLVQEMLEVSNAY